MYTEFFGLREKPFELLPNPKFLFLSKGHKKALSYLEYGIQERVGFTLLTGEVGSGKTTLLRNLLKELGERTTLSMVFNTRVDARQLLALINEDFGLAVEGKDKVTLLRELNDFLVEENSNGRRPIVIIDEAQNLNAEALEEIRLLSNLEFDSFKMLQIVLVGQPELKELLARPELRQLRQRISVSCHLGPLDREETEAYIFHRLEVAGNRAAVELSEEVLDGIYAFTTGGPRQINVICDFMLLAAFVESNRELTPDLLAEARKELSLLAPEKEPPPAPENNKKLSASSDLDDISRQLVDFVDPQGKDSNPLADFSRRLSALEDGLQKLNLQYNNLYLIENQTAILEHLIGQNQRQHNVFEDNLRKLHYLLNKLSRLLSDDQKNV